MRYFLQRHKILLMAFVPPLALLPLPLVSGTEESKAAYGLILMAIYWITEVIPLPVTALMSMVLFPLLGVSKASALASQFFPPITGILLGGLAVAMAIEKCNIHKRLALKLLMLMGTSPKWLMLGFMVVTAFLSMWISNTATTSMMVPIAQAVLVQLVKTGVTNSSKVHSKEKEENESIKLEIIHGDQSLENFIVKSNGNKNDIENRSPNVAVNNAESQENTFDFSALDADSKNLCKAMMLSICYAANTGGTATLTGTAPNLVMKGYLDSISNGQSGINFTTWFIFSFPVAVICLLVAWITIQAFHFGLRSVFRKEDKEKANVVHQILKSEYTKLGNMTFAEKLVSIHFLALVLLWYTGELDFMPGWKTLFKDKYVNDAVPALLVAFFLFVLPSDTTNGSPRLLDWYTFNKKFPWGVLLLLGGGIAIAMACQDSGLSMWLANQLAVLSNVPPWVMMLIICIIVSLSTEVTTNTAICTLFMPILSELAMGTGVHPLYTMLPAAIATSFAFMLPIATPPNTIVFSYGYLSVMDMVKVGVALNFLCVIVLSIGLNTWGVSYYSLNNLPDWMAQSAYNNIVAENSTLTLASTVSSFLQNNTYI